jgi:hypothetical protein
MAGRKHHYIQQHLLKGFAYDPDADPSHVWVYRTGKSFPTALENYGAQRDFYGAPGQNVTDLLVTDIETERFDDFLTGLRSAGTTIVDPVLAAEFALFVFARTNNLRSTFETALRPVMARATEVLKQPAIVRDLIKSELRSNPAKLAEQVPPQVRTLFLAHIAKVDDKTIENAVNANWDKMVKLLDDWPSLLRSMMSEGHNRSLRRIINNFSGSRVEELKQLCWTVRRATSGALILGDSVVVCELQDGTFKQATEPGDQLKALWIPIAHDLLLSGQPKHHHEPAFDVERVNTGSASCSLESFCSRNAPPAHEHLIPSIGTNVFRLDQPAQDKIVQENLSKLLAGSNSVPADSVML